MKSKWEYKKLGDVAKISSGKSIPAEKIAEIAIDGMYPCYGGNGLRGYTDSFLYDGKYPIIGRVGALCGNVHLAEGRFYPTEHALVVSLKSADVPEYITYLLSSLHLNRFAKGVAQPVLSAGTLAEIKVPIPPLDEQQRIVAELDLLTEVIDKRRIQLTELDTLAQSIFYDMFGDPIENEKGWVEKRLGEACDVRDGTHDSPKYVENGYPLVTSKNVVEGTISFQDVNYICQEDYDAISKRSRVDDGDIIMPMIGTIGKPVVVKKDREFAIKNVALIKFLPETSVLNVFVLALMSSSSFNTYMLSKNKGGTQKFIALGDIRKLMIPVPPLTLQQEFADKIQSIEKQKAAVNQSIVETQKLLDYTMDKYFG